MLPFSAEAFFALFESYNRAIWPAQIGAYLLGLAALGLAFRPAPWSGPAIAAILALAWAWNGIAYHHLHFAEINFLAPAFALFFVVQAVLFAWSGAVRGRLAFRFRPSVAGWSGLAAVVFAMAVYPLLGWLGGHGWPQAPMFGVAPCPTVIFTFGMLLLAEGRVPAWLLVIPLAWSLVGGSAAWLLQVPEDLSLPVAGILGTALILWRNRRGVDPEPVPR